MDYKELVESKLSNIATTVIALVTNSQKLENTLNKLGHELYLLSIKHGDENLSVAENLGERFQKIGEYVDFAQKNSRLPANYIFSFTQNKLRSQILEPLDTNNLEIKMPVANLARLKIAAFGKSSLLDKRENLAKILSPEIREKNLYMFDLICETAQKIEFIKEFRKQFVTLEEVDNIEIDKDGRAIVNELSYSSFYEDPYTHAREYDPDYYPTGNKIVF